jgi:hypothetical protein
MSRWSRHSCRTLLGEPFTEGIGAFGMNRRFEQLDAAGFHHTSKTGSKLAVVISNQIRGRLPVRGSFSQRYAPPRYRSGSVSRPHGSLSETRSSILKNAKSGRKKRSVTCKRVARPDLGGVVMQKGCPHPASWLLCAGSPHVLAVWCACRREGPVSILPHESSRHRRRRFSFAISLRKRDRFLGNLGLARSDLGLAFPLPAKELPMPPK